MLPKVVSSNSSTIHRGTEVMPPPPPPSSSSSSSSKPGMVLGARGARACDMCGKEKARWFCAADDAHLCERCDACVHSANAVARRHERVKLSPSGSPDQHQTNTNRLKGMAKSKSKSKSKSCSKKEILSTHRFKKELKPREVTPLHTWIRAPRRKRSGRKPSNKACASGCFSATERLDYFSNSLISIKQDRPRDEEEDEDGVLLHPPTPAAVRKDVIVKCEPASPAFIYNQDSPSHQSISDRGRYDDKKLIKAELGGEGSELASLEVPVYEPFFGEITPVSHEELIRENLLSNVSPSLVPMLTSSSLFSMQDTGLNSACPSSMASDSPSSPFAACSSSSIWASQFGTLICKRESSNNSSIEPAYCDDMELSCVIEDGSISVKDEREGDSDMETFDVMNLCTQTIASRCSIEDDPLHLREDFSDMEMQACCNSIFGGNPFKSKGESELEMSTTSYMDRLEHEGPNGSHHYFDEHHHNQHEQEQFVFVHEHLCGAAEEPSMFSHKSLCLQLDYEDVLNAWCDRGSLWMDGERPQTVPDLCFSHPGSIHTGIPVCYSSGEQAGRVPVLEEGGGAAREARVLRYKEKRRTRLFSKTIRYEVRKLNAERRPRMKGRFVKKMHDP